MKRIVSLLFFLSAVILQMAQTPVQQGVVKTRGRMVNGKLQPGQGLSGAIVHVRGNGVEKSLGVKNQNGSFSFNVPATTFLVTKVQKQGYQLVDADLLTKPVQHSKNTLYIVMETPQQQADDKLASERQIRRTLETQLHAREDEIETLREQNKITTEDYQKALQKLYADQENNEKLIREMAEQYSKIDYDQLDDLNRRISDAIYEGRLMEADSLLRSKGDINSRMAQIRREQQAESQREEEIAKEQEDLASSKEGTKKKLEDLASDCYRYFDRFKLASQHDSAAYYITYRAELDTANAGWQFDAGYYLQGQNQFLKAAHYYEKALEIRRRLANSNPQAYEPDVAATLNNLADLYRETRRFTESEAMYKEALEIYRRLAESSPQFYNPFVAKVLNNLEQDVALTLNHLAVFYYKTQRFTESEAMYNEALEIYRRLANSTPQAYEQDVAATLNNLANLYRKILRLTESEAMHNEALEIYRRLANSNPQTYEPNVAGTLTNLANLYSDTQRFTDSEAMYNEALEICRRLAESAFH